MWHRKTNEHCNRERCLPDNNQGYKEIGKNIINTEEFKMLCDIFIITDEEETRSVRITIGKN